MYTHIYLYKLTRLNRYISSSLNKVKIKLLCSFIYSVEQMNKVEMTKSLDTKIPDFQKDVIIPQIYDLTNIKLIQSCGFKDSPINKVADLKKKKIENVIKSIVTK